MSDILDPNIIQQGFLNPGHPAVAVVDDRFMRTLSLLLAYDQDKQVTRFLSTDESGALHVNPYGNKRVHIFQKREIASDSTGELLQANEDITWAFLQNIGHVPVDILINSSDGWGEGFLLPPGSSVLYPRANEGIYGATENDNCWVALNWGKIL